MDVARERFHLELLSLAWMYCWIWDVTEPDCERQKRHLAHSYLTSLAAGCPRRKEREQRGRERLTEVESTGDQIPPGRTRVCRHAFLATEVARKICQRVYTSNRKCFVHIAEANSGQCAMRSVALVPGRGDSGDALLQQKCDPPLSGQATARVHALVDSTSLLG